MKLFKLVITKFNEIYNSSSKHFLEKNSFTKTEGSTKDIERC